MKTNLRAKELSWLSFNARVLQEAADPKVPILERIKFLGIYSSNLDEFFRVRVATLRRIAQLRKKARRILGYDPKEGTEGDPRDVAGPASRFRRGRITRF